MNRNTLLTTISLVLVATSLSSTSAADAGQADAILQQMSDTLAGAKEFSFTATREISPEFAATRRLQPKAKIEVQVSRPASLFAKSSSKGDVRSMFANGKSFTLLDVTNNLYATVPMKASLDALPGQLAAIYGFAPPLVDFIVSDSFRSLKYRTETIASLGRATFRTGLFGLNGIECERLALTGKLADAELWIGVKDHLPRKLTATLKGPRAAGSLNIVFTTWNLSGPFSENVFNFVAPEGAERIPMISTAEAKAGAKSKN